MITQPKTIENIVANREEWACALESDDYQQTTSGDLRDHSGFCCLGVLKFGLMNGETIFSNGGVPVVGLTNNDWEYLATANDAGTPFRTIAQIIRDLPLPTEVTP